MISQVLEWDGWSAAELRLVGAAIVDVARDFARVFPPPRGMPFYGLDHPAGEVEPYTRLAAHGIFRKYESVLLLGAGLGGAARWCHATFGCDVTGVDPTQALGAEAQRLSLRAQLGAHTAFLAARAEALPLRTRGFTHVWGVEGFADVRPDEARLREVFRVVRLGGLVALQQSDAGSGWVERASAALGAAGLVSLRHETVQRPPLRDGLVRARQRLLQLLQARQDERTTAVAVRLQRQWAGWPLEGGPVTQVFGRRPS